MQVTKCMKWFENLSEIKKLCAFIRLRVAVRVMRACNSVPLLGVKPVIAPSRGSASHWSKRWT